MDGFIDKILRNASEILTVLAIVIGVVSVVAQFLSAIEMGRTASYMPNGGVFGALFAVSTLANALITPAYLLGLAAITRALQNRKL